MKEPKVKIFANKNGTFLISKGKVSKNVDVRTKNPEEKYEAIRSFILEQGWVFSKSLANWASKITGFKPK